MALTGTLLILDGDTSGHTQRSLKPFVKSRGTPEMYKDVPCDVAIDSGVMHPEEEIEKVLEKAKDLKSILPCFAQER